MTAIDADIQSHAYPGTLSLVHFDEAFAPVVARWVQDDDALRWLAPGTRPPLTAEKVMAWLRPGGHPFLLSGEDRRNLLGYAELNPMRRDPSHYWFGHVIVRPDMRGKGLGLWFVQAMLAYGFDTLCARRVSLIVYPENFSARRCYRRAGFKETGSEYHEFRPDLPRQRLIRCEMAAPS